MSIRSLQKIQNAVTHGEYDVTIHAVEEMAEDGLDIFDVESAIMNGQLTKTEIDDPRGERYTVIGTAVDRRTHVGIVGRFRETGIYLIITVDRTTE